MEQITFHDLFKKSFLAMAGSGHQLSALDIILNILVTFGIGMFIFYIYRKTFQGVVYQKTFNISLVIAAVVTSLIIMTISGNLILSLGMVGALSIVRFRTPIKDSIDLVFLFWAISIGIADGVGYYTISVIGSILIALIIMFLTRSEEPDNAYLLILQLPHGANETELVESSLPASITRKLKSKSMNPMYTELTYEVRIANENTDFLNKIKENYPDVRVTLISYRDELASV